MTIRELINALTDESTVESIMPELVTISEEIDAKDARIAELEADVLKRDEEIKDLKEYNFDLTKKIINRPEPENKPEVVEEEYISEEDIWKEMEG